MTMLGILRLRPIYYASVIAPVALGLKLANASPALIFISSAVAVVPAAALMSDATEQLSARSGPGVAGLLNVLWAMPPS